MEALEIVELANPRKGRKRRKAKGRSRRTKTRTRTRTVYRSNPRRRRRKRRSGSRKDKPTLPKLLQVGGGAVGAVFVKRAIDGWANAPQWLKDHNPAIMGVAGGAGYMLLTKAKHAPLRRISLGVGVAGALMWLLMFLTKRDVDKVTDAAGQTTEQKVASLTDKLEGLGYAPAVSPRYAAAVLGLAPALPAPSLGDLTTANRPELRMRGLGDLDMVRSIPGSGRAYPLSPGVVPQLADLEETDWYADQFS